ncbi:MAG: hypothetical protein KF684_04085 [Phycisphaeraceae bacterium]|nr:hypothetical protein [Phycisphaeraceae bacterium]
MTPHGARGASDEVFEHESKHMGREIEILKVTIASLEHALGQCSPGAARDEIEGALASLRNRLRQFEPGGCSVGGCEGEARHTVAFVARPHPLATLREAIDKAQRAYDAMITLESGPLNDLRTAIDAGEAALAEMRSRLQAR